MTARLEAARAAVFATVQMYAPVHAQFAPEATRQLTVALAEVEAAAVEAARPAQPPPPPLVPGIPEPPAVFKEPKHPEAVADITPPAPADVAAPADEIAASLPPPNVVEGDTPKGKRKK